jgi:dinuclear metal center YbgI/SA1388 family protein
MAQLSDIIAYLDELLEAPDFPDYGPNGLQVPGAEDVTILATGVSAHRELFERAAEAGAQLVIAHHGLFWDFHPRSLSPAMRERLRVLFENDIALAGYHLPLDAHPEVGNNAILAERLGCERHEAFGSHKGAAIGRCGTFPGDGIPAAELFERVRDVTARAPTVFDGGPERVRRIGIVSGGGAGWLEEAIDAGLDAFLTGEPREHVMSLAREAGIHFIAAGHYATETFGVRALGDWLVERFGIRHVWVDIPNPV